MALDENNVCSGTGWGVVIFFLILFWIFTGGFNRNNNALDMAALLNRDCGQVTNCEIEKRSLLNTAEITDTVQGSTNQISAQLRRQYDAMQGEKMFDLKLNALSQQQSYEAKLAAKDATIERMTMAQGMTAQYQNLMAQIADIKANMLVKPQVTGVGAVCPNAGIINGLGIGSSLGNCYNAGNIM